MHLAHLFVILLNKQQSDHMEIFMCFLFFILSNLGNKMVLWKKEGVSGKCHVCNDKKPIFTCVLVVHASKRVGFDEEYIHSSSAIFISH